jgi:hypothetical protein
MLRPLRLALPLLGLLALAAVGLLLGPRARAEDASPARPTGTWFYDVRIVRVDPTAAATIEVAPTWKSVEAEPERGITTTAWADLLAGLKARGGTTILFDQRVTTRMGVVADFSQKTKKLVPMMQSRTKEQEVWTSSYLETGVTGQLIPAPEGLQYMFEVNWDGGAADAGSGPFASATWRGATAGLATGTTLALWHRQQAAPDTSVRHGTEIYVFVTARLVRGG